MHQMLTRLTLLAVALLALGWVGVLWRDHRIVDGLSPALIGNNQLPAKRFEHDARRLQDAELLNPDPTWRLNRGLALLDRNPRRAARDLERVVASEPENVTAWKVLYVAARQFDRPLAARARARVKQLDPLTRLQR
jgi:hypothetical protein